MQEIWIDVPKSNGFYSVSNLGRIRSNPRTITNAIGKIVTYKSKVLKPLVRKDGYLKVNLCLETGISQQSIHRLVALCFLPNPENLPEVNHLDNIRTNNVYTNLEWCSRLENNRHAVKQGRNFIPEYNRLEKDVIEKIRQLNSQGISSRAIAKELNISRESVKRYIS